MQIFVKAYSWVPNWGSHTLTLDPTYRKISSLSLTRQTARSRGSFQRKEALRWVWALGFGPFNKIARIVPCGKLQLVVSLLMAVGPILALAMHKPKL